MCSLPSNTPAASVLHAPLSSWHREAPAHRRKPASIARNTAAGGLLHATELGQQPNDSLLWNHAREGNWTILTRDTDFFDRIMLQGPPPKVIWVRLGNIRKADLESLLIKLWPAICNLLTDADLIEVHPTALEAVKRFGA